MSIIGTENYGNYVLTQDMPQWIKHERYEYCEPFFDTISAKGHKKNLNSFVQILVSLFL